MADVYTRVLVEVSYAAGSAEFSEVGEEVLTLLQPGTHHEAAALLAWDPVEMRHRSIASAGYQAETVEQLGDRYLVSEENRALEAASGPVRIDDLPRYRETPMFRDVLAPAGFQDGMTSRLYRDDGSYAGMLHVSAADAGTFDHRARDLVAALTTVMSRLTMPKRSSALLPPVLEGALVGVVDRLGGVKPVDGCQLPLAIADQRFQAVVVRFLQSSSPAAVGLWPTGQQWVSVTLTRVVDRGSHVAALVQETPAEPIPYGLSNRELDVLAGMASGQTNRQIASSRSISVRTVTSHVENILRKMDTGSRATAVVAAARHGLLRLDCAQVVI